MLPQSPRLLLTYWLPDVKQLALQEPRLLLGLQSANLTASLAFNLHPVGKFRDRPVSLHIIIPCVGRESIFRMLDSLEPQLEAQVWHLLHMFCVRHMPPHCRVLPLTWCHQAGPLDGGF